MNIALLSVRTRLTIWHTLIMALVLAMFALGIYGFVRESLLSLIDSRLEESLAIITTARDDLEELAEVDRHAQVPAFRVQEGPPPPRPSRRRSPASRSGWAPTPTRSTP